VTVGPGGKYSTIREGVATGSTISLISKSSFVFVNCDCTKNHCNERRLAVSVVGYSNSAAKTFSWSASFRAALAVNSGARYWD
jgi:hypothetical protein